MRRLVAFYLSVADNLIHKFGSLRFTPYALIVSSLCTMTHYSLVANFNHLLQYREKTYPSAVAFAILSTVLPTFLVTKGIKRIGSSRLAIIASVGPVSALVFGFFPGLKLGAL